MNLSGQIEQAVADHGREFPSGNWKAVNERLGDLFRKSAPILTAHGIDPWTGGNEGRALALRKLGY